MHISEMTVLCNAPFTAVFIVACQFNRCALDEDKVSPNENDPKVFAWLPVLGSLCKKCMFYVSKDMYVLMYWFHSDYFLRHHPCFYAQSHIFYC